MVKAKKIVVCIDSSLFLAEVFGNETQSSRSGAIDKLEKFFTFEKYMSETVKEEVKNRLSSITCLIANTSKNFISDFRVFKGLNPNILLTDLPFIESFFKNLKKQYSVNKSERQIIENIESVLVNYLIENFHQKKPQNVSDFVILVMIELNKILTALQFDFFTKLDGYNILPQMVNPNTCQKLQNEPKLRKTIQRKSKDIKILCEVEAFQQNSGKKCLLATLDHKDFLNNSALIDSLIDIKCVDPIYLPNELS